MHATEKDAVVRRLDALSAQVAFLVEKQQGRADLYDELAPVLRGMMSTATAKLDAVEKRGWFELGGALAEVAERILDHYSAADVRALGDAVVTILDTVRVLTQPQVLSLVSEAGTVLQHADEATPLGLVGMIRASHNDDVRKGMAVLMDVLRHVGRAADAMNGKARAATDRTARLAAALGPRRKKALGIERTSVKQLPPHSNGHGAACATPPKQPGRAATVIDGVAFTAEGHLVDASAWTRELAENIAAGEGIALGPDHWRLIETARADYAEKKVAANIRRLTQIAGVSTKAIYALFPKAPGRTIARIAGTPKPAGCL